MRNYRKNRLNSSVASADIRTKVEKLVDDAILDNLWNDMNDHTSYVSNTLDKDSAYDWSWAGLINNGYDREYEIDERIDRGLKMIRDAWVDFYLYHADEDVNSSRRVNSNRGSGKLNSSRHLPYQAISIPVILRDWDDLADNEYYSSTHKKLVDIGDTLYNDGMGMAEYLKPEFKKLYDEYGEAFWKQVVEDAAAIDSQMSRDKVKDLKDELVEISFKVM